MPSKLEPQRPLGLNAGVDGALRLTIALAFAALLAASIGFGGAASEIVAVIARWLFATLVLGVFLTTFFALLHESQERSRPVERARQLARPESLFPRGVTLRRDH